MSRSEKFRYELEFDGSTVKTPVRATQVAAHEQANKVLEEHGRPAATATLLYQRVATPVPRGALA
jgi:hypothetical protein